MQPKQITRKELCDTAAVFIGDKVTRCNTLIKAKRLITYWYSLYILLRSIYGRIVPGVVVITPLMLIPIVLMCLLALASIALYFVARRWTHQVHDYMGWLVVAILRRELLDAPSTASVQAFVALAIRQYGTALKCEFPVPSQQQGMVGYTAAHLYTLAALCDTVGVAQ